MHTNIHYCSVPYDKLYTRICRETHRGAYVSYLRGKRCQTDQSFFYEISASFQFPNYFGMNWNALHDCLCDLAWLHFTNIVIIVDDFSLAFNNDSEGKELMLRQFDYMVDYWVARNIDIQILLNN